MVKCKSFYYENVQILMRLHKYIRTYTHNGVWSSLSSQGNMARGDGSLPDWLTGPPSPGNFWAYCPELQSAEGWWSWWHWVPTHFVDDQINIPSEAVLSLFLYCMLKTQLRYTNLQEARLPQTCCSWITCSTVTARVVTRGSACGI